MFLSPGARTPALTMLLTALAGAVIHAQSLRLPPKDIAVLVDVSKSVKQNRLERDPEVKQIITTLVNGGAFDERLFHNWEIVTDDVGSEVRKVFGNYLKTGQSAQGAAELSPLTGAGNKLLVLPLGKLMTVISSVTPHPLSPGPNLMGTDFASQLNEYYPKDAPDGSTCFWYAMARAAETLKTTSHDGYYLFVVSDEEDDPDYRADGPPPPSPHSDKDYQRYREEAMLDYPPKTIRSTIAQYFVKKPNNSRRNAELYTPGPNFRPNVDSPLLSAQRQPGGHQHGPHLMVRDGRDPSAAHPPRRGGHSAAASCTATTTT